MRTVGEDTIAKDVRIAIDENTAVAAFEDGEGNTIDTDTLEMDDIIRSKIADGLNAVRMAAPLSLLELDRATPEVSWTDEEKGIGKVELPADYMRLALFKMSDWQMGASEAISPVSPLYRQQFSEWKGVRGNPSRPVVAISADTGNGGGVLEFFSCDSTEATATLLYVGRVSGSDENAEYDIEEAIYRAVVLKTASLVMASYSNDDMMQLLATLGNEQLSA